MNTNKNTQRIALLSGLSTAVGMLSPVAFAIIMTRITNRHGMTDFGQDYGIFVTIGLGVIVGGLWGEVMARLTGIARRWRMRIAGALTLIPTIFLTVLILTLTIEGSPLEDLPQHQLFLIIFPISAFIVAMLSALGLHLVSTTPVRALRNAVMVGLVSGVVFLIVAVVMDALGYRIGTGSAGHLIKLPPMPFVTITATFFGAMTGGGLLGVLLARADTRTESGLGSSHTITEQREIFT